MASRTCDGRSEPRDVALRTVTDTRLSADRPGVPVHTPGPDTLASRGTRPYTHSHRWRAHGEPPARCPSFRRQVKVPGLFENKTKKRFEHFKSQQRTIATTEAVLFVLSFLGFQCRKVRGTNCFDRVRRNDCDRIGPSGLFFSLRCPLFFSGRVFLRRRRTHPPGRRWASGRRISGGARATHSPKPGFQLRPLMRRRRKSARWRRFFYIHVLLRFWEANLGVGGGCWLVVRRRTDTPI